MLAIQQIKCCWFLVYDGDTHTESFVCPPGGSETISFSLIQLHFLQLCDKREGGSRDTYNNTNFDIPGIFRSDKAIF